MTTSNLPTAYTPLECVLLFQQLRAEGSKTEPFSFNRISEQLKGIPFVRNDATYDSGRLSPDALRDLYLYLVKEEVKRDLERQAPKDSHLTNGDVSPESRKRKAPSPSIPTVHEAAQHSYLIPRLVDRLYGAYREKTIKELREQERKYESLSRDISDIEAGKWDERLQRQRTASATFSPKPSTAAHTRPAIQRPEHIARSEPIVAGPTSPQKANETNPPVPPKRYSQATIDAVINHGPEPQYGTGAHRRTSSGTTLPPLSEMAPESPRFGIPKLPGHVPAQMQHLHQPYAHSPPNAQTTHQSPYASHHGHPGQSPQVQHAMARPSSSPRPILPPPRGMELPPPIPGQHSGSPGLRGPLPPQQHYQPQHRSSLGPSPTSDRPIQPFPAHLPPPPAYYQQQYPDRRTSYPANQASPIQQGPPSYPPQPHRSGYQMQPFMGDASQPGRHQRQPYVQQQQQQAPPPLQSPIHVHNPSMYPQAQTAPASAPRPLTQANPGIISAILATLATPDRPQRKPLWKSERQRRPPPLSMPSPAPQPVAEPLSPVLQRAAPARSTRARGPAPSDAQPDAGTALMPPKTRRRQRRGGSPSSIASSTADGPASVRTARSQSTSTAVGAVNTSDDRPSSRGKVKHEPSTPANLLDQTAPHHEPSATPVSGGPMTRKRRGTLQSQPQHPSKRMRQKSPSAGLDTEVEMEGTPPAPPTTVIATRNFAKTSATIMNDITSHKHASYFAGPVRDKDASGYSEIIKKPQHLKSIRTAITAGTRAVATAASTLESPSGTPTASTSKTADGAMTVELERTEDIIPPKAIVNATQLEKEVYRMFANAVMFNPGEDGLVADTREMFEDVEAKIKEWRGAEREAGGDEEEEGKGKRRKL